jgi:hypothetical protein
VSNAYPFHLRDGDEAAAESPYTFFIPLREERVEVVVGDLVKLGFEYEWETEEYGGERMWVIVTSKSGLEFSGSLDNQPWEKAWSPACRFPSASSTFSTSNGLIRQPIRHFTSMKPGGIVVW